MANEFDSSHPVVPVRHPETGDIHNISVPPDTDLGDLHAALSDAGYTHNMSLNSQPTAAGAIENSPEFKKNATELWNSAGNGKFRGEAGNFVTQRGGYTKPVITPGTDEGGGRIVFNKPSDAMGIVHTHPHGGGLSPRDIQTAKDNHLTVYAIDLDGLHAVGPDGKITEVYRSVGDLLDKKKKAEVQPAKK
jgi:hypothetical protein